MKKLIMVIAAVIAGACLAAANDPLIPATVQAGKTYGLICKGESLSTFKSNLTGNVNFQGVASRSADAADYEVVELSTSALNDEGSGTSAGVGAGEDADASNLAAYVCTYGDGVTVLAGERCVLVRSKTGFKGFTYDYQFVDPADVEILDTFTANANGVFSTLALGDVEEGWRYEFIVLDTRLPDGTLAKLVDSKPELVSGWGTFALGDEGQVLGINWNAVKIGADALFYATGKTFEFNPTKNLAMGLAATLVDGAYQVHVLPKANEKIVENGVISSTEGYAMLCEPTSALSDPFTLDVTYMFQAFDETVKKVVNAISPRMPKDQFGCADFKNMDAINEAAMAAVVAGEITVEESNAAGEFLALVKPFWDWNCDFEVTFDRPIKAGTYVLAGRYEQAKAFGFDGWVCSAFNRDLTPDDKPVRLLKDNNYKGVSVTYYEICSRVQEFLCGAINLEPENYGTTMTVKLCIYDREDEDAGRIEIGTYKYTFCGPLKVMFNDGIGADQVTGTIVNPETIDTNYDGRASLMLPVPAYDKAANKNITFVGWSNRVDDTIITFIPTNTWKTFELYSTWKAAQTVDIAPTGGTETVAFKVTEEWLAANEIAPTKEALEAPQGEAQRPAWQNYLLGMDPNADLKVEKTNGEEDDKALVVSTVQIAAPDTGIKVGYSLDRVDADEKFKGEAVAEQESKDLKIDLEPQDVDTPTGYYKMNVVLTPTDEEGVEGDKIKIPADNTIGVLKVETEEPLVPIAVPWVSLENSTAKEDVLSSVSEVVKTSTLTPGDTLSAMSTDDAGNPVYFNWKLDADGNWVEIPSSYTDDQGDEHDISNVPAKNFKLDRGLAVWVERQNPTKPLYLMGKYNGEQKTSMKVAKGTLTDAKYNLVAPTSIEDTDLNGEGVFEKEEINEGDQVMVLRKSVPTYFTFSPTSGKWGYSKSVYVKVGNRVASRQERVEDDASIKAGTGMWYISKGGEPTINW